MPRTSTSAPDATRSASAAASDPGSLTESNRTEQHEFTRFPPAQYTTGSGYVLEIVRQVAAWFVRSELRGLVVDPRRIGAFVDDQNSTVVSDHSFIGG